MHQRRLEQEKVDELIEDVTGGYTRLYKDSDKPMNQTYEFDKQFNRASQIRRAIDKARLVGKGEKGKGGKLAEMDLMQITNLFGKFYTGTA